MTKVSRKQIDPKEYKIYINNLWSAFTLMGTKDDIRKLFKDIFTKTEFKMFAKRLQIARLLLSDYSYEQIQKELGVTSGTITSVNDTLAENGGGYRKAHKLLLEIEQKILKKEKDRIRNLENPFIKKMHRKTLLGTAMRVGIALADKKIREKIKLKSLLKQLDI